MGEKMAHWMGLWSCKSLFDCGWLLQLSTGIIGFIALYLFIKKILKNKRFQSLEEWLGYKFEAHKIFLTSMKIIFWSLGIYYSAEIIVEQFGCKDCIKGLRPLRDALVVLSISWMIYRMQQEFSHAKKMRIRGLVHAFSKIFSVCLVLFTGLILLRIFNVDIVPLIAFGGIGAAVLGFAAKDVMSSVFGGMMLSVTRPFALNDLILIPDRNLEGTIEEMGWCLTVLRDKDQRLVYLPNSLFSQCLVINASQRTGRRILEMFRLKREDLTKIPALSQEIKDLLKKDPVIDKNQPILVFIQTIGEYSIEMQLDVYTVVTSLKDYAQVKETVLTLILALIVKHEMELAYPISLIERER